MATENELLEIVKEIRKAKKYSHLSLETVRRIVLWAAVRYPKLKEVSQNAKKKLHQVYGAYLGQFNFPAFIELVNELQNGPAENRDALFEKILSLHNSTKERLPFMADFYTEIAKHTGEVSRLIDLGCGLNPFSYPHIRKAFGDVPYEGYDIDTVVTRKMDEVFRHLAWPVKISYNDVFNTLPEHRPEDLVFLFKIFPCLEQQEKGVSRKIIDNLVSDRVVVSFPSLSLGGKQKGMPVHYREFLTEIIEGSPYQMQEIPFQAETIYLLTRI